MSSIAVCMDKQLLDLLSKSNKGLKQQLDFKFVFIHFYSLKLCSGFQSSLAGSTQVTVGILPLGNIWKGNNQISGCNQQYRNSDNIFQQCNISYASSK